MRKTINTMLVLVLMCSAVFAAGAQSGVHEPGTGIENPEIKEAGQGTGQGLTPNASSGQGAMNQSKETDMVQQKQQSGEQIMAQNKERLQQGLENALGNVKNENAKQRLQQNIENFQQKYQEKMQKMEGVEIEEVDEETGAVSVRAREEVKFLGFIKGKATKRFEIDNNGNVTEKHPWYRFLYSEAE